MDWGELLSVEKLEAFASWLGSVIVAIIIIQRTIKSKLNEINSKDKVPSIIKKQVDNGKDIQLEMEKVKEILNADRIQVYDFHNGGHYADGRSALKFDCTYEVCRYGINTQQIKLQNIPISCMPKFVDYILTNEVLVVENIESIKNNMPSTYEMLKSMNVTSFYDVVINNDNKEPIGFVSVQFCDEKQMVVDDLIVQRLVWYIEEKLHNNL